MERKSRKKSSLIKAVEAIADELVNAYGWIVEDDIAENEGEYLHVYQSTETGYQEVSIHAASFDEDGDGHCVAHLTYGLAEGDAFDVEISMRNWTADLTELDEELRRAFSFRPSKEPRLKLVR